MNGPTGLVRRKCAAGITAAVMAFSVAAAAGTPFEEARQAARGGQARTTLKRRPMAPLTAAEMAMARSAWKYFENNYHPGTGLTNSADRFPSTTLWDMASSFAATISALDLGLISREEFDRRMAPALKSLASLALFRGQLPNKVYNVATLAPSTYANQPGEIGYSALDIGRLLIWLRILRDRFPEYVDRVDGVLLGWNYCRVLDQWGTMYGASLSPGRAVQYLQEGRLGYEEYAAKGFALWGFDTTRASKPEPFEYSTIYRHAIPHDRRDPRDLGAHNYVVSESYVLDGVEFNWDLPTDRVSEDGVHTDLFLAEHADRIFLVQKARFDQTGILTARTEHQLDEAPYFVYDTIYSSGFAWNTITDVGAPARRHSALATKAAVGLWALWDDPYAARLFTKSASLVDPERGIYEGDYEDGRGPIKAFTANNNGIILEILMYRKTGKLLPDTNRKGPWDAAIATSASPELCRPRMSPGSPSGAR